MFAYDPCMGYSRRKELREIAESIEASNRAIDGVTLGAVCGSGTVMLPVACHACPRKGRYRVTRLIDRYGPAMPLLKLRDILAADCPKKAGSFYNQCGAYFPGVSSVRP